jgi:hypothetical protein
MGLTHPSIRYGLKTPPETECAEPAGVKWFGQVFGLP